MLTRILDVFRKITIFTTRNTTLPPMLGRWCILNKKYNNRKIDMANIDNCGTCNYDYGNHTHTMNGKKESSRSTNTSYRLK